VTITTPRTRRTRLAHDPTLDAPGPDADPADPASDTDRATIGSRLAVVARNVIPPLLVLVAVLATWYALSYLLLEPRRRFLLPPPHDVTQTGFLDAENLGDILNALWASTKVALTGLVIAIIVGTVFAVAMSQARWIERSFYPWAVVLQTIPILALVPLVGFWFEYGFPSRVFVCVLIALFPIVTNTLFGLKSADRTHHDLFSLYGATRVQRLAKLLIPGALPAVFAGWRISAGLSVIGAIVGDFFFRQGEPGIGRLLDGYTARLQSEQLFAAIICSSLLGLAVFWSFGLLSRLVVGSWHDSARTDKAE
jgi:NitT/TauT family transport system permease protein